jgi:hypothetical protein
MSDDLQRIQRIETKLRHRRLLVAAQEIAERHRVLLREVLGRRKQAPYVAARHELWETLYREVSSYPFVADLFEVTNASVVNGVARHRERCRKTSTNTPTTGKPASCGLSPGFCSSVCSASAATCRGSATSSIGSGSSQIWN